MDFPKNMFFSVEGCRDYLDPLFKPLFLVTPNPTMCHKFELRKEEIKLTREKGMPTGALPWIAFNNNHHRMDKLAKLLKIQRGNDSEQNVFDRG